MILTFGRLLSLYACLLLAQARARWCHGSTLELCKVGSRGLGKLRGSRRVGACSSAPREAAPTDDYRGSDRGLTRGAPEIVLPNVISRRPRLPN